MQNKYLTFFFVLLSVALAGHLGLEYLKDVRDDSVYSLQINQIKEHSSIKKIDDFHEHIDALRVFINKNSQHKEDEEFRAKWRDKTLMAESFLDYLEKRRKDLPHMECSSRAGLMAAILESEGYRTRAIDAYHPSGEKNLAGHALLDVWNQNSKKWETQDPEYDVYWKNVKTGERTSMFYAAADKNIQPCNRKGCGWNLKSREGAKTSALKALTAYVTVIDREENKRTTHYSPAVKPDAVYEHNGKKGKYCDVIAKNCRDGFLPAAAEK